MAGKALVRLLGILNVAAAAVLAVVALRRLLLDSNFVPLVLLFGLLIVGPVEDLLKRLLAGPPAEAGPLNAQIIDQATSLVLILSLIAAALMAR